MKTLKKTIYFALIAALCFGAQLFNAETVSAADAVSVFVNNEAVIFDQQPIIFEGRTLIPIRQVAEKMGALVEWYEERADEITVSLDGRFVSVRVDSPVMLTGLTASEAEDQKIELEVPPRIYNSRTLLPIRAVVENLGGTVSWDGAKNAVYITYQGAQSNKGKPTDVQYFADGSIYEGGVDEMNSFSGYGTLTLPDGTKYEGEMKDGIFHGPGKLVSGDGEITIEGVFDNGNLNGAGKQIMTSGTYEGNFENSLFSGKGVFTYTNGDVYEGDFENGLYNGEGKMTFANGDTYVGGFKNGLKEGYGKYTYIAGDVYEGEYKNNLMHGYGKYTDNRGNVFEGEFFEGDPVQ